MGTFQLAGEFQLETVEALTQWFESCNDAQQAAVGAALLSRANPKAAHLLQSVLQHKLHAASFIWCQEIQLANDPTFVNGLRNEAQDVAVSQLLHYLPLLRPNNTDAARGYIHLLPRLLGTFLEEDGNQALNAQQPSSELQQLLTYALIHPALSIEHKRSLAELIRQLDDGGSQEVALSLMDSNNQGGLDLFRSDANRHQSGAAHANQWDLWNSRSSVLVPTRAANTALPPSSSLSSSSSSSCSLSSSLPNGQHSRIRRSNSLTPSLNTTYAPELWTCQEDNGRVKGRSHSLSTACENSVQAANGNCSLSPPSSLASSGSGSGSDSMHSDDNQRPSSFHISGSGMKDVPSWLKGLRLHKYAHLFSLLSYDEMLQLTEEQLEMQNVTKGARHKIALSIQRLRDRPNLLCQLEKEVVETGAIHNALNGLKNILSTPIKPYHGPAAGDEPLFDDCLSPPPSLIRDDTSGCSSLDGSTDSLAPRLDGTDFKSNSPNFASMAAMLASGAAKSSDMPTVIVSAAPDTDSGGECSDDTSGDDCMNDASHSHFPYSLTGDTDIGPANLPQDDLAGRITRLLGKICTQLLVSIEPSEENVSQFVTLLERCLNHEAFTQRQRRRIISWKEQAHRIWNTTAPTGRTKTADSRFTRRWSNVAHYPGFYSESANQGSFATQANSYSLFPPRHQRNHHVNRQHTNPHSSHNLYGQHNHLSAGQNPAVGSSVSNRLRPLAPTHSLPLNASSLQVGSHVPLQHRNSFCVSALSQSSLYSHSPCPSNNYSSLSCTLDPFTYSRAHQMNMDDLSVENFSSRLADPRRARSMASESSVGCGTNIDSLFSSDDSNNNSSCERDASDMDLNHRLESLCLSMTEHALAGANDS